MLARFVLWRLIELVALGVALSVIAWLLGGGLGRTLGDARAGVRLGLAANGADVAWSVLVATGAPLLALALAASLLLVVVRCLARRRRRYVRLRVVPYRTDESSAEGVVALFDSLHKRVLTRGCGRALLGQPSLALEVHSRTGQAAEVWLAVSAPAGMEDEIEAALRVAYPNVALERCEVLARSAAGAAKTKEGRAVYTAREGA